MGWRCYIVLLYLVENWTWAWIESISLSPLILLLLRFGWHADFPFWCRLHHAQVFSKICAKFLGQRFYNPSLDICNGHSIYEIDLCSWLVFVFGVLLLSWFYGVFGFSSLEVCATWFPVADSVEKNDPRVAAGWGERCKTQKRRSATSAARCECYEEMKTGQRWRWDTQCNLNAGQQGDRWLMIDDSSS